LGALWRGASEAWRAERRRGHECCSTAAAATVLPPADPLASPASRAVAMLSGGQSYSAWNFRKRRLVLLLQQARNGGDYIDQRGEDSPCEAEALLGAELRLSELAIRSFPKSHEAWAHRRWLMALRPDPPAASLDAEFVSEMRLSLRAIDQRRANYHAARHAARAVRARVAQPACAAAAIDAVAALTRSASARASGDASVLFARLAVVRAACSLRLDLRRGGETPRLRPFEVGSRVKVRRERHAISVNLGESREI